MKVTIKVNKATVDTALAPLVQTYGGTASDWMKVFAYYGIERYLEDPDAFLADLEKRSEEGAPTLQ